MFEKAKAKKTRQIADKKTNVYLKATEVTEKMLGKLVKVDASARERKYRNLIYQAVAIVAAISLIVSAIRNFDSFTENTSGVISYLSGLGEGVLGTISVIVAIGIIAYIYFGVIKEKFKGVLNESSFLAILYVSSGVLSAMLASEEFSAFYLVLVCPLAVLFTTYSSKVAKYWMFNTNDFIDYENQVKSYNESIVNGEYTEYEADRKYKSLVSKYNSLKTKSKIQKFPVIFFVAGAPFIIFLLLSLKGEGGMLYPCLMTYVPYFSIKLSQILTNPFSEESAAGKISKIDATLEKVNETRVKVATKNYNKAEKKQDKALNRAYNAIVKSDVADEKLQIKEAKRNRRKLPVFKGEI